MVKCQSRHTAGPYTVGGRVLRSDGNGSRSGEVQEKFKISHVEVGAKVNGVIRVGRPPSIGGFATSTSWTCGSARQIQGCD